MKTSMLMMLLASTVLLAAGNDENAGTWRMIVVGSPTQIAVAAPTAVTDAAYVAELNTIRNAQAQMTEADRELVEYWNRGGVLRWNQLMLELVARHNLPPAPLPNGTYPIPDAANPFADPMYPFSNPPYAARAYSYIAVAQYEALKVAWYYKYLYNRPAPARVDRSLQALGRVSDLPAYPSEDAVLAGVNVAMMQLLFPTDAEQITRTAGEQRQAALLAGRATASDVAAGVALGQAVANLVIARARVDGMGGAVGSAAAWQALADGATARGEMPWRSMESPPRPPMLPLFGRVLPWNLTPAELVAERPAGPPSTRSQQMATELAEVRQVARKLTRAQMAIAYKWSDGPSTPAPPGHWNFLAWPFLEESQFSEVRMARAVALLNMAMHDAAVAAWDTKYTYFNPRPSQLDPGIRTVVGLPNFPAYPSGHSTFSAAAAEVLTYLFPQGEQRFAADMEEASISRLYGAIHYRSDLEDGKRLGRRIGGYTVRMAREDGAGQ
jgi:hypothetical protein